MTDPDAAFVSVSHWGMFFHDEMAEERAVDALFAAIFGRPKVKCGKSWREMVRLWRLCLAAYRGLEE